jgi:AcrR family transcriptional regulator
MELMREDDLRRASVDRISARSGVSKATIYKWWPNRTAVAIEAFLYQMMAEAPVPDTGSAAEDFRLALRGMMRLYTSPLGEIFAQLIGESQFYPTERERIRTHQVNVRRAAVRKIWDRGVARGELDPNLDSGAVPTGDRARRIDAGRRRRHRGHSHAGTGQPIS